MRHGMKKPIRNIDNNKILSADQKSFLHEFTKSELRNIFRLTGGTALSAFYIEHRLSEDLDFFTSEYVPLTVIDNFLKSIDGIKDFAFSKLFDRNIFNLRNKKGSFLKVEFTKYQLKNIEDCAVIDRLMIDSFLDITVNKLCAIADRFDAKDYVDLYCALKNSNISLKKLMDLAENKCEIKGIKHVLKSRLLHIPEGTDKLPLMVDLSEDKIKALFEKLIKDIITTEIT
jgi:predicted nucleotidyltransferase component of viral defense system